MPNPDDELGRLARTLNGMIARLERSFEEVRRFTADAAHELRTPLAILRNEAEVALRIPRESEQYRDCLENMLEEIDHLSRLSEAFFSSSARMRDWARTPGTSSAWTRLSVRSPMTSASWPPSST